MIDNHHLGDHKKEKMMERGHRDLGSMMRRPGCRRLRSQKEDNFLQVLKTLLG
jgi:hypothetical protein